MSNWYVFSVQTGQEQIACKFLNSLFNKEESVAFIPQVEFIFKNSGLIRKELKPMFPGYVFTDSELDASKFINQAYKYVRFSKCIYKLLGSQSIDYIKLSEDEKKYLLSFFDERYITEESKGIIVGDKVIINSGPLKGKESFIKKIDRHKRRAEIEMIIFGNKKQINVSIEIMSKA